MTLSATVRRGCSCSASYTTHIPHSPSSRRIRYRPIIGGRDGGVRVASRRNGPRSLPVKEKRSTAPELICVFTFIKEDAFLYAARRDSISVRISGSSPHSCSIWTRRSSSEDSKIVASTRSICCQSECFTTQLLL